MGREKSAIRLPDGRTMACRCADALTAAGALEVVGLGGPPERAAQAGLAWVPDAPGPAGPLAGLEAGLHLAVDRGVDALALLPTDLPRVEGEALAPLVDPARRRGGAVVVAEVAGRRHHPVSVWPATTWALVASARRRGVSSFHRLMESLDVVAVDLDDRLADADLPGDLDGSR